MIDLRNVDWLGFAMKLSPVAALGGLITWVTRPRLALDCPDARKYFAASANNIPEREVGNSAVNYFHVAVTNPGSRAVKNAEVLVTAVFYTDGAGVWRQQEQWPPTALTWERERSQEHAKRDIPPKAPPVQCDIGSILSEHAQSNRFKYHIRFEELFTHRPSPPPPEAARFLLSLVNPHNTQPNALPAGRCCLVVTAVAENARAQSLALELNHRGQYATPLDGLPDVVGDAPGGVTIRPLTRAPEVGTLAE